MEWLSETVRMLHNRTEVDGFTRSKVSGKVMKLAVMVKVDKEERFVELTAPSAHNPE